MLRSLLAALALTAAATLAGCTLLPQGDGREGDLVRIVTLAPTPEGLGDVNDATDVLAAIADVRFEYTHQGEDRDAADLTITYVEESGAERVRRLSEFTDAQTVARGDRITITGALLTSPVRVDAGDDRLASRGGPSRDWLRAGGYPLPLAMDGGIAEWDVDGGLELDGGFDVVEVVQRGVDEDYACEPSPEPGAPCVWQGTQEPYTDLLRLSDAEADATMQMDGSLRLGSVGSFTPALRLSLEGDWLLDALFNVHVLQDRDGLHPSHSDADVGFDLDLSATGDGALRLGFGNGGQLEAVGGEGELDVSGSFVAWDEDHPRSASYSPEDVNEFDVHTPYEETPVPSGDNPVDFVVRALQDLWRMDLAPGDEFRLDTGEALGPDLPSVALTVRVVGGEEKRVPAGTFDTLRVETSAVLTVPIEAGSAETFELPTLTTWVHESSGLPVAIEQRMAYAYTQDDFAPVFAAAESWDDGLEVTPPQDLHIDLEGRTVAELTEWKSGFHMAPMASVLLPLATFASPFASFVFAGISSPFYGFDEASADAAPDVAFRTDEPSDRIVLVKADSDLQYWEFEFRSSQPLLFAHNADAGPSGDLVDDAWRPMTDDGWQPFLAGDFLEVCGPAGEVPEPMLGIRHVPSNTLLFEATLRAVAAC